ncbi:uncharacterized protein PHACADRAFT_259631 [Phanerochaete carnosa HHB-10118-sp]|uniref:Uncharacterized protein n=1 Tax=Phanerochaete carnosa (strain HHB-10118-sp) TaxID=650164 RepID=K5W355_PHACS|nr:uncharacterized protein PHACADRAFT_259631 [Phanerochaete carnosa HHB-10118-sp]EKM53334.1 hypothetical protein PHACADRAFT_259631 [Phanerochaete carnosa HHB-10118-sp]
MASLAAEQQNSPLTNNNDLRHVTSNVNLASPPKEHRLSQRASQHLRTGRLGSRSPASIPSSPTSVHSSSSAIFERDIEPLTPSTPLHHATDPHRIPRGKLSEQLDQSVPSVLDSAAEMLTADPDDKDSMDFIAVVTPVSFDHLPPISLGPRSGFTSPISQMSSRSPSPNGMSNRKSVILGLPSPTPSFTMPLPGQTQSPVVSTSPPMRPAVQTNSPSQAPAPSISTPTSAYFSVHSEESSPTTATHVEHPLHTLSSSTSSATPTTVSGGLASHAPPSPKNPSKRLSFLSYTDLLTSVPASTHPLSSFTQFNEPPPHLSSVIGIPQAQAQLSSGAASIHGSLKASAWITERDPATDLVNDVGGEWEREGLGRGLEERLETLMVNDPASPIPAAVSAAGVKE